MADKKELEKINQAAGYFERYFEFEDAVKVSYENREYLKTYIHDNAYVVKNFNVKSKILKHALVVFAVALAVAIVFFALLGADMILVPIIAFGAIFICGTIFVISLNKFRLTAAEQHQVEVNDGINEQLVLLEDRIKQVERQKDDYYTALQKRVDFMSLDYMKNVNQIKEYLENGQAETCEDAVEMFEQALLMQEMTSIMTKSEEKIEPAVDAKERFGDPLKVIKENKKKKKKQKKTKQTA